MILGQALRGGAGSPGSDALMETTAKLDRLRVMIVEDNQHMLLIVKTILRGFGIKEFVEARGAEEAWEKFTTDPVDILVVDRILGGTDALDLVRRIRNGQDSPNAYLPIVMLSAHSERTRVEEARDAGITEYCCKPVTSKDLFSKVANVIDHPRAFIRTKQFFGPDRRRRDGGYGGEERREDGGSSKAA